MPQISIGHTEGVLNRYGDLVPFFPLGRADDEAIRRSHEEIEKATAGIFATYQAASMKILDLTRQITGQMMQHHPAALCPRWYWNDNIFDLEESKLKLIFIQHPVRDSSDFILYLESIMSGKLHQKSTQGHCEASEKLETVVEALGDSIDPRRRFDTVRFASTTLADLTRRMCKNPMGRGYHDGSLFKLLTSHIMGAIREEPEYEYLNAAEARRSIWTAYEATRCTRESSGARECVHVELLLVLELLQATAYQEIRKHTYLVVGDKLPAELADLVVEATLEAEELPLDPEISELLEEPHPSSAEDEILVGKVLPQYRCFNVQYDRRGERGHRYGAEFSRVMPI